MKTTFDPIQAIIPVMPKRNPEQNRENELSVGMMVTRKSILIVNRNGWCGDLLEYNFYLDEYRRVGL